MRKIKFRIWDNAGFMSRPFTLTELQIGLAPFPCQWPTMQYIGLEDGYGNEIYEGDIVQCDEYNNYLIVFDERRACFAFALDEHDTNPEPIADFSISEYTIIGNIYQSPELLEV